VPALLLATGLVGLVLAGVAAGIVLRKAGPTGWVDRPVESFAVEHRQGWLTEVMRPVTDLGSATILVPLVVAAGLGWRWRRGSWRPLALLAGAAAGAWVVQVAVKQLVERPRPPAGLALSHATGFAFPSGHATDAAAVYGMLAVLLARPPRRPTRAVVGATVGLIALVGLSRLYLGVHWLTDVLAGMVLGAGWIVALVLAAGRRADAPPRGGRDRPVRLSLGLRGRRPQSLPADGLLPFLAGASRMTGYRRLGLALAVFVAAALIIPELAEGTEPTGHAAPAGGRVAGRAAPTHPREASPLPAVSHVLLVVEENHEFGQVIGSPKAPFLSWLAARGTLLTHYYAVTHPSLPNYVALVAGSPLGIHNDCRACHRGGRTLVDQLQAAGISWKAYYQGLPTPCSEVASAGAYVKKVNPFLHLDSVRTNPLRCRRVVPLTQLGPDLRRGRLPRFTMVTPDLIHDMHSGSVHTADAFLQHLEHRLRASSEESSTLLIVTFDEGKSDRGRHGRHGGGHIATIVAGPGVPAGSRDPGPYDHYALLRSLEQRFGLRPLRHAADSRTRTIPAIAGPAAPMSR
jgi:membrane-associated phospholipid phosphatase